MKFWDSSAILPLCLHEPRTSLVEKIVREDFEMVAWWGTPIEGYSAFARLRREDILDDVGEQEARACLNQWAKEWTEMEPSLQVRDNAARVLLLHPLRAADSLQLAAALVWANQKGMGHEFVCLDRRLRGAAQREGFSVLPREADIQKGR
jgi:predicted nucleic acid-binding protein